LNVVHLNALLRVGHTRSVVVTVTNRVSNILRTLRALQFKF
jgi:hypothetical protein